jgi:hypothetical protein
MDDWIERKVLGLARVYSMDQHQYGTLVDVFQDILDRALAFIGAALG